MQSRPRGNRCVFLALSGLFLGACAGKSEPVAANHACFRALDCQDGLVCVEGRCTDDIGPIVPEGAGTAVEPGGADTETEPGTEQTDPDPETDPDPYGDD